MRKKLRTKPPVNAPGEAQGLASIVAAPPTLPAITVLRPPSRDLAAEFRADRALELAEEQLDATKLLYEELAGERRARPALEPLAPSLPTAAPLADPVELSACRVVSIPVLTTLFADCMDQARALGLDFPAAKAWRLVWVDAPAFRRHDGTAVRRADGFVTVYINATQPTESFRRTIFHELRHLADYHAYGTALSVEEMERKATAFVARALAPWSPPEPEGTVFPWQAGPRPSYAVGGLPRVHPDYL